MYGVIGGRVEEFKHYYVWQGVVSLNIRHVCIHLGQACKINIKRKSDQSISKVNHVHAFHSILATYI